MTFLSQMGSVAGVAPFDGLMTFINGSSAIAVCDVMMWDGAFTVVTNYDIGDPASLFVKTVVPDNTTTAVTGPPATGTTGYLRSQIYPLLVASSVGGVTTAQTAIAAGGEYRGVMFGVVSANVIRASGDIAKGDPLWSTGANRNLTGSTTPPAVGTKVSAWALQTKSGPSSKVPCDVMFNGWTGWRLEAGT